MERLSLIICFSLLVNLVSATPFVNTTVTFQDCNADVKDDLNPNIPSVLKSIRITGCTSERCPLERNTPYIVEIDFRANQNSQTATIWMAYQDLVVGTWNLPIVEQVRNACAVPKLGCPLRQGQDYTLKYTFTLPADKETRSSGALSINLTGDNSLMVCATLSVQIQNN